MYIFNAYRCEDCIKPIFQDKKAVKLTYHKHKQATQAEFELAKKNFEARASATAARKGRGKPGKFKSTVVKGKRKSAFKDDAEESKTSTPQLLQMLPFGS